MREVYKFAVQAAVKGQILLSALSLSLYSAYPGIARGNEATYAQPVNSQSMKKTTAAEHEAEHQFSKSWHQHNKRACELWNSQLYAQARSEAVEACRLAPNEASAHTNLAEIMQSLSAIPDAISRYEMALNLDPNNLRARIGLAQCLAIIGNKEASLDALAIAKRSSASDPELTLAIGELYSTLGLYLAAKNMLINSLNGLSGSIDDKKMDERATEGLLLASLKTNDTKLATRLLEKILISSPSKSQIYIESAKHLCTRTSTEQGEHILASAIKNRGYCAQLFFELGQIFETKAGLCLESPDKTDNQRRNVWLNLAEKSLRQSIVADPNEAKYCIALAGCLDIQNKKSEAIALLSSFHSSKHNGVNFDKSDIDTDRNDLAAMLKNFMFYHTDSGAQNISLRSACFRIENLSCGCRLNDIENKLRTKYGMIYVNVFHDGSHSGMIVYNPKKTTFSGATNLVLKGAEKADVLYEIQISTIEQLASMALAHTTRPEAPLLVSIVGLPPK